MPAPTTIDDFLDLVRRSGLVDRARLDSHIQQLRAAGPLPTEPRELAERLIEDGWLTYFQAEQFMMGKYRGFTIGKYDVLERLGVGGTGIVYLCEHRFMRRRAAIKVLATHMAENPLVLERFYREAQAVAALDHPNIVRAHDIDQDGPLHFLVMEYVEGTNLDRLIRKLGALEIPRACEFIRQAALGLQHAHEAGLVHRDIKPGNLLLDRQGVIKILDLGLARFFDEKTEISATKYAELLGTADYLSPEQAINGDQAGTHSDIYSLGATFHYLLVGKPPFEAGSLAQKLICHQLRPPQLVCELRPEVPMDLAMVIKTMMAKEPQDRYPTAAAVLEALAPWVQGPLIPIVLPPLKRLSPLARRAGSPIVGASPPLPPPSGSSSKLLGKAVAPPPSPSRARKDTPPDLSQLTQRMHRERSRMVDSPMLASQGGLHNGVNGNGQAGRATHPQPVDGPGVSLSPNGVAGQPASPPPSGTPASNTQQSSGERTG
jgi:serine/threonine protein kinase